MTDGAPIGTLGLANKTGWMTTELFTEVMKHYIKHSNSSVDNPSLLLFDNHESHLSAAAINLAKENGVYILTFPPHCTNKLQPLDVGLYKPLKTQYEAAVNSWMTRNPGKPFTIYNTAAAFGIAHLRAMTPSNITSAFRATGIYPFDKHVVFTEADYLPSATVTERPLAPDLPGPSSTPDLPGQSSTPDLPGPSSTPDLPGQSSAPDLPGPSSASDLAGTSSSGDVTFTKSNFRTKIFKIGGDASFTHHLKIRT
ncbi:hypothetical protein M8J76_008679 [Diaphorina citri]|nr:hypothetical protein M8J76_008679 [Diaphorina citri]